MRHRSVLRRPSFERWLAAGVAGAAAFGLAALVVQRQTRRAEQAWPPRGRFVSVHGVRLHFIVRGRDDAAQTLVLLHGEGVLAEEFLLSGLVDQACERYRVIVFDRPGHGHSDRPAGRAWGPEAQAALIQAALTRLGVQHPIVLGHGWGALVALALGLNHPQAVGALVLESGYYFPSARLDVPLLSAPALPGIGTLLRHTLSPLLGRLLWPLTTRRLFAPAGVPQTFRQRYPVWMSLRPSQLQACAAESAALLPAVLALQGRYHELQVPTVLVAGAQDRHFSTRWHSGRLAERLQRGWLRVVENSGHMVHHVAPGQVLAAVHQAAAMAHDVAPVRMHGLKAGSAEGSAGAPVAGATTPEADQRQQFLS